MISRFSLFVLFDNDVSMNSVNDIFRPAMWLLIFYHGCKDTKLKYDFQKFLLHGDVNGIVTIRFIVDSGKFRKITRPILHDNWNGKLNNRGIFSVFL